MQKPSRRAETATSMHRGKKSMLDNVLKEFISLSGAAIEEEDRIILGRSYVRGVPCGILRLNNERYYQFICWKACMARWDADVEAHGQHDLVLSVPSETGKLLAVFEMKRWMSPGGETEIPGIRGDLE
jgi:hypothetical protein